MSSARLRFFTILVCTFPAWCTGNVESHDHEKHQILRITVPDSATLAHLRSLEAEHTGFEIWSEVAAIGTVEARVPIDVSRALVAKGLKFEVLIDDLDRRIGELFHASGDEGFFDSYRTYEEHLAFLESLANDYQELAQLMDFGTSVNGRPLRAIRITGPGDGKPGVLFHGAQHGNEIMGPCAVAYAAKNLLEQYATDTFIRNLVDNIEWYFLPITNPDGYVRMSRYNANSVDLNRNWDGPGSGLDPTGGQFPFSEPETAALRDFLIEHPNVRAHIDFHTYGQLILWPWGHTYDLCDDNWTYDSLGSEMQMRIQEVRGTFYLGGPSASTLYQFSGGSKDYSYGVEGLWAFVFELGYSHTMPAYEILPISEEMFPAMIFLGTWILDCNGNDIPDHQDLAEQLSDDCNFNETPDECEVLSDFDGDGIVDVCDPDIDNDGVLNDADQCDDTPLGVPVQSTGAPFGDSNENCASDLIDYGRFERCYRNGGPNAPVSSSCLQYSDADADQDIDLFDMAVFQLAFTGGGQGPCGPGNGSCFSANGTPGCDDASCCELICSFDSYCCDVEWDSVCAVGASILCDGR